MWASQGSPDSILLSPWELSVLTALAPTTYAFSFQTQPVVSSTKHEALFPHLQVIYGQGNYCRAQNRPEHLWIDQHLSGKVTDDTSTPDPKKQVCVVSGELLDLGSGVAVGNCPQLR